MSSFILARLLSRPAHLLYLLVLLAGLIAADFSYVPRTSYAIASQDNTGFEPTNLAGIPVMLYVPTELKPNQATSLIVALHGLGGSGEGIGTGLLIFARQNKAILLAPTFNYESNWHDVQVISKEEIVLTSKLNQMVSELETRRGLNLQNRVMLYGFSRGAQLAHRYAILYPQRTLAAVVLAAGSYTLPYTVNLQGDKQTPMPFPYGVADLAKYTGSNFDQASLLKVNFWQGVGALDNNPDQTPPAWDAYLGKGRLNRAQKFYQVLKQIGCTSQLTTFPNTGHEETVAMREAALQFFRTFFPSQETIKPEPDATFFSQTKHSLGGPFKKYWEKHGGLAQFGYPVTEKVKEYQGDKTYTVQYFQRARFEFHPEFAGTDNEVLLGLLGKMVTPGARMTAISKESSPAGSRYFEDTGHSLSGGFLKYWQTHGGLPIYGYPLTEPFEETNPDDGKIYLVQYFERNRFELHPEFAGTDNEVLLGLLGTLVAQQRGYLLN